MNLKPKEIDIIALANDGRHFAERRDGAVRIIDSLTGKVVCVQNDHVPYSVEAREDFNEVLMADGSKVLVQKGLERQLMDPRVHLELQPFLLDEICQRMAEGESLMEICMQPGMPSYNTLCRWRRKHDWVKEALSHARADRAEYMRDKAVTTAERAQSEDPIDTAKLQVETYKWAAGVDDAKFSNRAKVETNINMPTQILVMTGINRDADPAVDKPRDVTETLPKGDDTREK